MEEKAFKTVEEQLDILRSRGLSIDNDEKAKEFLDYSGAAEPPVRCGVSHHSGE